MNPVRYLFASIAAEVRERPKLRAFLKVMAFVIMAFVFFALIVAWTAV